ncbi:MAG: hypothetical protein JSW20_14750 [Nitrospiraceae bacterium]|nr:MAG: hypothetical protein JSW20_14750 [Nitrospiraceae bacterium]
MNKYFTTFIAVILTVIGIASTCKVGESAQYLPVAAFENLTLDSRCINSYGAGLIRLADDSLLVGTYTHHKLHKTPSFDYPKDYHSIDFLYEKTREDGQLIALFKSDSDKPVTGGYDTFEAALVYGFELYEQDNLNVIFGGGLAVGDFGIELSNGDIWPVIPVPIFRVKYESPMVNAKFDFITSPNLQFTVGPEKTLRLKGDFRIDQFRDSRDLIYEVALMYRLHSKEPAGGDYGGVSLGVKNDNYGAFNLGRSPDESLELHYNALFAELDLAVLKVTGGYAFNGRELYGEETKHDLGDGYFMSVQITYPL